jgi:hypothetical protein
MSFELFNLLPAVYRIRDAQLAQSQPLLTPAETAQLRALQALLPPLSSDQQAQLEALAAKASRGPLESLLMVIQEQLGIVAEDLDQLYDDQFIETCAPWVIPYIGDLIGYQAVQGIAPSINNPRSEVADTISFRRRKGTVLVMEQLARDATAWGAHAVEFFRILGDTQYMNHIRLWNHYAPDVRRWEPGLFIDTGFDRTSHRIDVRRIASRRGRYNIQNIGIFLWSLNTYSITQSPAAVSAADPLCLRFNSLGMDMPLFHRAVSQGEEITAAAQPVNVADRLRRRVLCADVQKGVGAAYYGEGNSLAIYLDNRILNPYEIQVADLAGADGSWVNLPGTSSLYRAVIDPELGRLAVTPSATGAIPKVQVSYHYGFNGDMGGGEYARTSTFTVENEAAVFPFPDTASTVRYTTLQAAIDFAIAQFPENGEAAVEIDASRTYPETGTLALTVDLPAGTTLELRAADGARPTLLLSGEISVSGAESSSFYMNGLLIAADPGMAPGTPLPAALMHVPAQRPDDSANHLGTLNIQHCTLVPGWSVDSAGAPQFGSDPNLIVEPSGVEVVVSKSILGAVRTSLLVTVQVADSIIDATDRTHVAYAALDSVSGGGALTLLGCTVVGKVHATVLSLVSDSIFWGALTAGDTWETALISDRRQQGCVRFSFLPEGARTPRRFECVEQALASPQPIFFAFRYARPGYLKLLASTPDVVRKGADDGGEMGAFHFVLAPLREIDLRVRMQEYLPVGLEFGVIYQN